VTDQSAPAEDDPTGDHDQAALDEAARRMHATKPSEAAKESAVEDPEGDHDPAALKDAEDKMGVQR
jgi:hypothetical protein